MYPFPWPPMRIRRVAQHVSQAFNHASNTHPAERLATLIEEDVVRLDALLRVGAPVSDQYKPLQGLP